MPQFSQWSNGMTRGSGSSVHCFGPTAYSAVSQARRRRKKLDERDQRAKKAQSALHFPRQGVSAHLLCLRLFFEWLPALVERLVAKRAFPLCALDWAMVLSARLCWGRQKINCKRFSGRRSALWQNCEQNASLLLQCTANGGAISVHLGGSGGRNVVNSIGGASWM